MGNNSENKVGKGPVASEGGFWQDFVFDFGPDEQKTPKALEVPNKTNEAPEVPADPNLSDPDYPPPEASSQVPAAHAARDSYRLENYEMAGSARALRPSARPAKPPEDPGIKSAREFEKKAEGESEVSVKIALLLKAAASYQAAKDLKACQRALAKIEPLLEKIPAGDLAALELSSQSKMLKQDWLGALEDLKKIKERLLSLGGEANPEQQAVLLGLAIKTTGLLLQLAYQEVEAGHPALVVKYLSEALQEVPDGSILKEDLLKLLAALRKDGYHDLIALMGKMDVLKAENDAIAEVSDALGQNGFEEDDVFSEQAFNRENAQRRQLDELEEKLKAQSWRQKKSCQKIEEKINELYGDEGYFAEAGDLTTALRSGLFQRDLELAKAFRQGGFGERARETLDNLLLKFELSRPELSLEEAEGFQLALEEEQEVLLQFFKHDKAKLETIYQEFEQSVQDYGVLGEGLELALRSEQSQAQHRLELAEALLDAAYVEEARKLVKTLKRSLKTRSEKFALSEKKLDENEKKLSANIRKIEDLKNHAKVVRAEISALIAKNDPEHPKYGSEQPVLALREGLFDYAMTLGTALSDAGDAVGAAQAYRALLEEIERTHDNESPPDPRWLSVSAKLAELEDGMKAYDWQKSQKQEEIILEIEQKYGEEADYVMSDDFAQALGAGYLDRQFALSRAFQKVGYFDEAEAVLEDLSHKLLLSVEDDDESEDFELQWKRLSEEQEWLKQAREKSQQVSGAVLDMVSLAREGSFPEVSDGDLLSAVNYFSLDLGLDTVAALRKAGQWHDAQVLMQNLLARVEASGLGRANPDYEQQMHIVSLRLASLTLMPALELSEEDAEAKPSFAEGIKWLNDVHHILKQDPKKYEFQILQNRFLYAELKLHSSDENRHYDVVDAYLTYIPTSSRKKYPVGDARDQLVRRAQLKVCELLIGNPAMHSQIKSPVDAHQWLTQILEDYPKDTYLYPQALYLLGEAYFVEGKSVDWLDMRKRIEKEFPDSVAATLSFNDPRLKALRGPHTRTLDIAEYIDTGDNAEFFKVLLARSGDISPWKKGLFIAGGITSAVLSSELSVPIGLVTLVGGGLAGYGGSRVYGGLSHLDEALRARRMGLSNVTASEHLQNTLMFGAEIGFMVTGGFVGSFAGTVTKAGVGRFGTELVELFAGLGMKAPTLGQMAWMGRGINHVLSSGVDTVVAYRMIEAQRSLFLTGEKFRWDNHHQAGALGMYALTQSFAATRFALALGPKIALSPRLGGQRFDTLSLGLHPEKGPVFVNEQGAIFTPIYHESRIVGLKDFLGRTLSPLVHDGQILGYASKSGRLVSWTAETGAAATAYYGLSGVVQPFHSHPWEPFDAFIGEQFVTLGALHFGSGAFQEVAKRTVPVYERAVYGLHNIRESDVARIAEIIREVEERDNDNDPRGPRPPFGPMGALGFTGDAGQWGKAPYKVVPSEGQKEIELPTQQHFSARSQGGSGKQNLSLAELDAKIQEKFEEYQKFDAEIVIDLAKIRESINRRKQKLAGDTSDTAQEELNYYRELEEQLDEIELQLAFIQSELVHYQRQSEQTFDLKKDKFSYINDLVVAQSRLLFLLRSIDDKLYTPTLKTGNDLPIYRLRSRAKPGPIRRAFEGVVGVIFPALVNHDIGFGPDLKLRDHQIEALEAVSARLSRIMEQGLGAKSGQLEGTIVSPTGSGKTRLMSAIFAQAIKMGYFKFGDKFIILNHTDSIHKQNLKDVKRLEHYFNEHFAEEIRTQRDGRGFTVSEYKAGNKDLSGDVVVVSIPSMKPGVARGPDQLTFEQELERALAGHRVAVTAIDEQHHLGLSEKAGRKQWPEAVKAIRRVSPETFQVGFTATPVRGDKPLVSMDLRTLMKQGVLPRTYLVPLEGSDFTNTEMEFKGDDLDQTKVGKVLLEDHGRNTRAFTGIDKAFDQVLQGDSQAHVRYANPRENTRNASGVFFGQDLAHLSMMAEDYVKHYQAQGKNIKVLGAPRGLVKQTDLDRAIAEYQSGAIDGFVVVTSADTKKGVDIDKMLEEGRVVKEDGSLGGMLAMFTVRAFVEGSNLDMFAYQVKMAPSGSLVKTGQEAGRTLRWAPGMVTEDGRILQDIPQFHFDVVDQFRRHGKSLVNYGHAFRVLGYHNVKFGEFVDVANSQVVAEPDMEGSRIRQQNDNEAQTAQGKPLPIPAKPGDAKPRLPRKMQGYDWSELQNKLQQVLDQQYGGDIDKMSAFTGETPEFINELLEGRGWQRISKKRLATLTGQTREEFISIFNRIKGVGKGDASIPTDSYRVLGLALDFLFHLENIDPNSFESFTVKEGGFEHVIKKRTSINIRKPGSMGDLAWRKSVAALAIYLKQQSQNESLTLENRQKALKLYDELIRQVFVRHQWSYSRDDGLEELRHRLRLQAATYFGGKLPTKVGIEGIPAQNENSPLQSFIMGQKEARPDESLRLQIICFLEATGLPRTEVEALFSAADLGFPTTTGSTAAASKVAAVSEGLAPRTAITPSPQTSAQPPSRSLTPVATSLPREISLSPESLAIFARLGWPTNTEGESYPAVARLLLALRATYLQKTGRGEINHPHVSAQLDLVRSDPNQIAATVSQLLGSKDGTADNIVVHLDIEKLNHIAWALKKLGMDSSLADQFVGEAKLEKERAEAQSQTETGLPLRVKQYFDRKNWPTQKDTSNPATSTLLIRLQAAYIAASLREPSQISKDRLEVRIGFTHGSLARFLPDEIKARATDILKIIQRTKLITLEDLDLLQKALIALRVSESDASAYISAARQELAEGTVLSTPEAPAAPLPLPASGASLAPSLSSPSVRPWESFDTPQARREAFLEILRDVLQKTKTGKDKTARAFKGYESQDDLFVTGEAFGKAVADLENSLKRHKVKPDHALVIGIAVRVIYERLGWKNNAVRSRDNALLDAARRQTAFERGGIAPNPLLNLWLLIGEKIEETAEFKAVYSDLEAFYRDDVTPYLRQLGIRQEPIDRWVDEALKDRPSKTLQPAADVVPTTPAEKAPEIVESDAQDKSSSASVSPAKQASVEPAILVRAAHLPPHHALLLDLIVAVSGAKDIVDADLTLSSHGSAEALKIEAEHLRGLHDATLSDAEWQNLARKLLPHYRSLAKDFEGSAKTSAIDLDERITARLIEIKGWKRGDSSNVSGKLLKTAQELAVLEDLAARAAEWNASPEMLGALEQWLKGNSKITDMASPRLAVQAIRAYLTARLGNAEQADRLVRDAIFAERDWPRKIKGDKRTPAFNELLFESRQALALELGGEIGRQALRQVLDASVSDAEIDPLVNFLNNEVAADQLTLDRLKKIETLLIALKVSRERAGALIVAVASEQLGSSKEKLSVAKLRQEAVLYAIEILIRERFPSPAEKSRIDSEVSRISSSYRAQFRERPDMLADYQHFAGLFPALAMSLRDFLVRTNDVVAKIEEFFFLRYRWDTATPTQDEVLLHSARRATALHFAGRAPDDELNLWLKIGDDIQYSHGFVEKHGNLENFYPSKVRAYLVDTLKIEEAHVEEWITWALDQKVAKAPALKRPPQPPDQAPQTPASDADALIASYRKAKSALAFTSVERKKILLGVANELASRGRDATRLRDKITADIAAAPRIIETPAGFGQYVETELYAAARQSNLSSTQEHIRLAVISVAFKERGWDVPTRSDGLPPGEKLLYNSRLLFLLSGGELPDRFSTNAIEFERWFREGIALEGEADFPTFVANDLRAFLKYISSSDGSNDIDHTINLYARRLNQKPITRLSPRYATILAARGWHENSSSAYPASEALLRQLRLAYLKPYEKVGSSPEAVLQFTNQRFKGGKGVSEQEAAHISALLEGRMAAEDIVKNMGLEGFETIRKIIESVHQDSTINDYIKKARAEQSPTPAATAIATVPDDPPPPPDADAPAAMSPAASTATKVPASLFVSATSQVIAVTQAQRAAFLLAVLDKAWEQHEPAKKGAHQKKFDKFRADYQKRLNRDTALIIDKRFPSTWANLLSEVERNFQIKVVTMRMATVEIVYARNAWVLYTTDEQENLHPLANIREEARKRFAYAHLGNLTKIPGLNVELLERWLRGEDISQLGEFKEKYGAWDRYLDDQVRKFLEHTFQDTIPTARYVDNIRSKLRGPEIKASVAPVAVSSPGIDDITIPISDRVGLLLDAVSAAVADNPKVINDSALLEKSGYLKEGIREAYRKYPNLFSSWESFVSFCNGTVAAELKSELGIDEDRFRNLYSVIVFKRRGWTLYEKAEAAKLDPAQKIVYEARQVFAFGMFGVLPDSEAFDRVMLSRWMQHGEAIANDAELIAKYGSYRNFVDRQVRAFFMKLSADKNLTNQFVDNYLRQLPDVATKAKSSSDTDIGSQTLSSEQDPVTAYFTQKAWPLSASTAEEKLKLELRKIQARQSVGDAVIAQGPSDVPMGALNAISEFVEDRPASLLAHAKGVAAHLRAAGVSAKEAGALVIDYLVEKGSWKNESPEKRQQIYFNILFQVFAKSDQPPYDEARRRAETTLVSLRKPGMSDLQLYRAVAEKANNLIKSSEFTSGINIRLLIGQVIADHYGLSLSLDTSERLYTQARLIAANRWGAVVPPSSRYNHDKVNMFVRMGKELREILGEEGFKELCMNDVYPFLEEAGVSRMQFDEWFENALAAHPDAPRQ